MYQRMFRCLFLRLEVVVECIGIRFRRVLFGMGGQPGQMMFCPMTGMTVSIYIYFFIHMLVIRNCVTFFQVTWPPL